MRISIASKNRATYRVSPSWGVIKEFIDELEISMYHFESFYGIPFNTLTQVKAGSRPLPAEYWHFIYEKIKPTYGAGNIDDYTKIGVKNSKNHHLTKNLTPESDLHGRLTQVF